MDAIANARRSPAFSSLGMLFVFLWSSAWIAGKIGLPEQRRHRSERADWQSRGSRLVRQQPIKRLVTVSRLDLKDTRASDR